MVVHFRFHYLAWVQNVASKIILVNESLVLFSLLLTWFKKNTSSFESLQKSYSGFAQRTNTVQGHWHLFNSTLLRDILNQYRWMLHGFTECDILIALVLESVYTAYVVLRGCRRVPLAKVQPKVSEWVHVAFLRQHWTNQWPVSDEHWLCSSGPP